MILRSQIESINIMNFLKLKELQKPTAKEKTMHRYWILFTFFISLTFSGHSHSEEQMQPSQINIDTDYLLDEITDRGLMPSVVENTIKTGKVFSTRGATGYHDVINNVRVIVNSETGKIITTISGIP